MIRVESLRKSYKITSSSEKKGIKGFFFPERQIVEAVQGISFKIGSGEMVGFIGPNGAGKSTTIKMLTGILTPDKGDVEVLGLNPHQNRQRYVQKIGVVFGQKTQLWWDLPLKDSFSLLRKIYRVPDAIFRNNIDQFYDLLGLGEFDSRPVRQLSLGQRMRGDMAAAMLHDPEVIFFDEPTIGLDIVAKDKIREFLRNRNSEKKVTMLFTTHDMQDIEKTCDRIIVIDHGSILYDGQVSGLRSQFLQDRILVVDFVSPPKSLLLEGLEPVWVSDLRANILFRPDTVAVNQLIKTVGEQGEIRDLSIIEADIDSVVRRIYASGQS